MTEESLFQEALAQPADERSAFLDKACEGQSDLRAAVEALLAAHAKSGHILDRSRVDAATSTGEHTLNDDAPRHGGATTSDYRMKLEAGVIISNRYTLQEPIGEGGMGEVWVARQTEPVKRRVVLKLIKQGMDSRAVLARFEQERQALAMMDHPHIAKVLDAGLTQTGQPFFVMELVNGLSLNKFCDEQKLTPRERLELFVPICQAVQHAHQKGIVHRDLKPANILITIIDGKPVPKVIDFGVAKATAGKLTDESMLTQFGAIVGTLEYMSPEQAGFSGEDIDTRADIYSLGVILYELLTGLRPIDAKRLKKAALTEMIRIIQEEDPSKPSTRLSTDESLPSLAALRQTEPRRLMAMLRGELDWVVMKCLEKHRDRRYETANALARDIQRYLADEAVEARPPSAGYRFGKFLKRNKGPVIAASVVLLTALFGTAAVLTVQYHANARLSKSNQALNLANAETRAALEQTQKAQEDTAKALVQSEESRKQAEAVGSFLVDAFKKPDPYTEGKDVKVADILDQALAGLARGFAGSKSTEGALLNALGMSYRGLGLYPKAEQALSKARAVREAALGPDHPDTLRSCSNLANLYVYAGRTAEAIALHQSTLKKRESKLGPDDLDTFESRNNLAGAYRAAGRYADAIRILEPTLKLVESKLGPDHSDTLNCRKNLAGAYQEVGRVAEAIPMLESTLKPAESKLGADHPTTLEIRNNLADAYRVAGRKAEAIALHESTLKLLESKLGPDHPSTLTSRNNLAGAYFEAGRVADAIPILEPTLKISESKLGPDHPITLKSRNNLAAAYFRVGRVAEAIPLLVSTLKLFESKLGPDHPNTTQSRNNLAAVYDSLNRWADSELLRREFLDRARKNEKPDSPVLAGGLALLGGNLLEQSKWSEAEPLLRESLAIREKTQPNAWATSNVKSMLGAALLGQKKFTDAEPLLIAGYEGMKQREAGIPPQAKDYLIAALERLVQLYEAIDKPDAARWRKELEASKPAEKPSEKKP